MYEMRLDEGEHTNIYTKSQTNSTCTAHVESNLLQSQGCFAIAYEMYALGGPVSGRRERNFSNGKKMGYQF